MRAACCWVRALPASFLRADYHPKLRHHGAQKRARTTSGSRLHARNMAPRKRSRAASSPSSSATAAAPKITLSGGEAHHSSLAALWRQEKLTDIALCAEGVEFKAHRAALASSS
eukprot:scaffold84648_cov78-Phaeocystis_antarctica.AAC.1